MTEEQTDAIMAALEDIQTRVQDIGKRIETLEIRAYTDLGESIFGTFQHENAALMMQGASA